MRILLYGAPCCGKSTLAASLFSRLKKDGYNIELSTEYVKEWTYIKREYKSFDNIFIFANQMHREDMILNGGFEHLISDTSVYLNCFYQNHYGDIYANDVLNISKKFEWKHPALHIFIDKWDQNYSEVGRFQNKEESEKINKEMWIFLQGICKNLYRFSANEEDKIYNLIKNNL